MRQSNSQLQNEVVLISCGIRTVEHRQCTAGLSGALSGLQDRILVNYTRIENAMKFARKLSIFCYVWTSSKRLVLVFPCWDIMKCLNASMLTIAVFWACATVLSWCRNW